MRRQYHSIFCPAIGKNLELLEFGHGGKPVLVFPSSEGRFFDYESEGMIHEIVPFIDAGKIHVFCIDSHDRESWYAHKHPADKARSANDYDAAVVQNVLPFIYHLNGARRKVITHGCSFGAYQAVNFFLHHPDACDIGIALSGNYSIKFAVGDFFNDDIYYNDPISNVPNLAPSWHLDRLRENFLIICCGQGAWEDWLGEAKELSYHLGNKHVPHILDLWGNDVEHHWYWWKRQIVHYFSRLDRLGLLYEPFFLSQDNLNRLHHNFHNS